MRGIFSGLTADRLQRDATWRKSLEVRRRLVGYLKFFSRLSATQSAILSRQERNFLPNSRWAAPAHRALQLLDLRKNEAKILNVLLE